MAHVTISINGKRYEIACDDGQEAHLTRLAKYVDGRMRELVAAVGAIGDDRLLVMTSLLIADEITELKEELTQATTQETAASKARFEEGLATRLENMAEKVESIAQRLENI